MELPSPADPPHRSRQRAGRGNKEKQLAYGELLVLKGAPRPLLVPANPTAAADRRPAMGIESLVRQCAHWL